MEYRESKFNLEGAMWHFEPSDSAAIALELFKTKGISNILIPGYGYGRNAKLFYDAGFKVTGQEPLKLLLVICRKTKIGSGIGIVIRNRTDLEHAIKLMELRIKIK